VLQIRERVLGPEHPDTLGSLHNLARCLQAQGKVREALPLSRRAVESGTKVLGPEHPNVMRFQRLLDQLSQ
jgi:hypothetical protein